jgi:hypothetical protein
MLSKNSVKAVRNSMKARQMIVDEKILEALEIRKHANDRQDPNIYMVNSEYDTIKNAIKLQMIFKYLPHKKRGRFVPLYIIIPMIIKLYQ